MFLIETYVAPSGIEGVGVFAAEPVAQGALVWTLVPQFDRIVGRQEYEIFPRSVQKFIDRYAYFDSELGAYLLDGDHSRFLNHSETALIQFRSDGNGYLTSAVAPGQELTCNYREFMNEDALSLHIGFPVSHLNTVIQGLDASDVPGSDGVLHS